MGLKKKKKLDMPSTIYVIQSSDDDSDWLTADKDLEGFVDGDTIGVYELVTTKKVVVRTELE